MKWRPTPAQRREARALLESMRAARARDAGPSWEDLARPEQLPPPGDWRCWFIRTGRGWGKTRTAAEAVRAAVAAGRARRIALVGATAADVRDVMIEGESGILAVHPDAERPQYEPSKRRVNWSCGAVATAFSADEPERLRGPEHDMAWCDELATWRRGRAAWDLLLLGLRIGEARVIVSTTPRPTRLMREIAAAPNTAVTTGRTVENAANLAPEFIEQIVSRYEGTRLGRQELDGEVLDDIEGAYWTYQQLEELRVIAPPELVRTVVAIDPATTHGAESNETGIAVAGIGIDDHIYVLRADGYRVTPLAWAQRAIDYMIQFEASKIIVEKNAGGDMVESTIRQIDKFAPLDMIHASRGKATRAEPIAAVYEQGRVHHVGVLRELEDQMTSFPIAADLDDRIDAVVYAITALISAQWARPMSAKPQRTQAPRRERW